MSDYERAQALHDAHVARRDVRLTVVAFYTADTIYEDEARLLAGSLDAVGMNAEIEPMEDRGSWNANTAQKVDFIRRKREALVGPLLYLDADAFVHENCEDYFMGLHRAEIDFGAHWYAGPPKGYDFARNCLCLSRGPCSRPHRMLSGTLFIGDTDGARRLLDTWAAFNAACAGVGWVSGAGQRNLWAVVTSQQRHLDIERIPGRFCYIFDRAMAYPYGEPRIIEHTIASHESRGPRPFLSTRRQRIEELRAKVGA